jgi:hypothetical protein
MAQISSEYTHIKTSASVVGPARAAAVGDASSTANRARALESCAAACTRENAIGPYVETDCTGTMSAPSEVACVATQAALAEAYDTTQDTCVRAPFVGDTASWCVQAAVDVDGTSSGCVAVDAPEADC